MEKYQIEAARLAKDYLATKETLSYADLDKFDQAFADATGVEAPGSGEQGYQDGYDAGQNECEECEDCSDKD